MPLAPRAALPPRRIANHKNDPAPPGAGFFLCSRHGPRSSQAVPPENDERPRRVLRDGHFCAKIKRKAEPGERGILISFHRPLKRRMGKKSPTARRPVLRASPRCFRPFPHAHLPALPFPPDALLFVIIPLPGAKPPLRKDPLCCCFTYATESRSMTPTG